MAGITPTEASVKEETMDMDLEGGDDEEKKVAVGMVCGRKNLYQRWDRHDRYTWTEELPDDLEEAAENEETMKYALLVRNSKCARRRFRGRDRR